MSGAIATKPDTKTAVLRLLGLARRSGALQLGATSVLRCMKREPSGVVILARDAGSNLIRAVRRQRGDFWVDHALFAGEELAEAFGRDELSVVSVHDAGFVSGLKKLMSETR